MYIGKIIFSSTVYVNRQAQAQKTVGLQPVEHPELTMRARNYVERSKRILLAIMNFDPELEDPFAIDFPHKRQVSRDLLQEATYLKDRLSETRQKRLRNLVAELERILLQIANLESERDLDSIELIKGGVDWQGVLLKIHLSDMREAKMRSKTPLPSGEKDNFGSL
jgi:hypothetical protein